MEIIDAENASRYRNTTVDYPGTTTSKTNVNIQFNHTTPPTMQNNVIGTPLTSPTSQSLPESLSSMVCVSEAIGSPTGSNGEMVINDQQAQSPVLKDQLQKLREFDDFVDALDKNISRSASMPTDREHHKDVNKFTETTVTNGKDVQSNMKTTDSGLSVESSSDGSPATIIIDDAGGMGGLMGLVSISPAISPIKRNEHASNDQNTRTEVNGRTKESNTTVNNLVNTGKTNTGNSNNMSKQLNHSELSNLNGNSSSKSSSSTPINSTNLVSLFDPHAPIRSPPSTAKQSWVLFEEDDNDDKMSTSSRGTSMSSSSVKYQGMPLTTSQFSPLPTRSHAGSYGSGLSSSPAGSGFVKDWVKFEAHSPRSIPNSPVVPQFTGGSFQSSLYSTEFAQDDRQSDITASASALSSHGSFSESHDNISSQEYMPLDSSPKNVTNTEETAATPEGWIKFEAGKKTPSPTKSNIYFVGTAKPGHTRSQSAGGPFGMDDFTDNDNRRRASSQLASQPEDHASSPLAAEPPLPIQQHQIKDNNVIQHLAQQKQQSDVPHGVKGQQHVMLPPPPKVNQVNAQVQSKNRTNVQQSQSQQQQLLQQQLLQQQQILLHQQQQHHLQKQKLAAVGGQLQQIQEQQLIQTSPLVETQSVTSEAISVQFPGVTHGNPFKEDSLKQQQEQQLTVPYPISKASTVNNINITPRSASSSPFNPFRRSTNGESGTTVTTSATWESFAGSKNNQKLTNSPGNPFKQMMITANVHPSHSQSEPAVLGTILEPKGMHEAKTVTDSSKPTQLPSGHQLNTTPGSEPQSPKTINQLTGPFETQKVLNTQITATSQSVPGDNLEVPPTSSQPEGDSTSSCINEYPREEVDPTEGWPLMLRCPDKKKLTGSRYWKPVHIRLMEGNVIQIFDDRTRKEPFRELPLQSNYDFGDRGLQAYDTRGKIHTIKLFYVSYKEKKRFSSLETMKKMEQLIKLGSTNHDVFRSFIYSVNEALMKLTAFRDRGRHYEQDIVTVTVMDDYRGYIDYSGEVLKQSITTDLNILAFLSGMPKCSIGLNDAEVKGGDEVLPRRDIIPNRTNEWIKFENLNLHKCVNKNVFTESRFLEFSPLDGCRFKLLQFRTRPKDKELPLYVKVKVSGENNRIDMRADLYLPARTSAQKISHHICENIMVRVPLPESWIRYFRKEKRFSGFSSIKSVAKKADAIKSGGSKSKLIEVSVGSAKYENAYKAVVWRIDRIPDRSTSLAVTHIMRVQLDLRSMNELPVTFFRNTEVEFSMPHTTASKTTVRSLAVATDTSPEKRVRYTARYEYQVEIEKSFDLPPDDMASECVMQ